MQVNLGVVASQETYFLFHNDSVCMNSHAYVIKALFVYVKHFAGYVLVCRAASVVERVI
jgi:hypothetical protein